MRIGKPLLLVTTPLGVGIGVYEGFELAGGLGFLLLTLVLMFGFAMYTIVATIRREQRESEAAEQ